MIKLALSAAAVLTLASFASAENVDKAACENRIKAVEEAAAKADKAKQDAAADALRLAKDLADKDAAACMKALEKAEKDLGVNAEKQDEKKEEKKS